MSLGNGVVGVTVTNVLIIGIIAIIFVGVYSYIRTNYYHALPVV
jgi:hypothetical protein